MNKKIIVSALLVLMLSVVFVACGKSGSDNMESSTTVAETTTVEFSTDESGETYVTNVNGEKIPVTTSKDGAVEFYSDLITKSADQVAQESQDIEEQKTAVQTTEATTKSSESTTTGSTIKVGTEDPLDESNAAVIDWSNR